MKNIKTYIIIGLVIIIVILSQCRNNTNVPNTVTFRDTIIKIDTIVKTITKHHTNLPVYIHDTILLNTPIDTNKIYSTYVSKVNDSLLQATITVKAENRPFISMKYTLKNYEINSTTLIKDSTHTEAEIKRTFGLGALLKGNENNFGFIPMIEYNDRKNNSFKGGYDVINKDYYVGYIKHF